MTSFIRPRAKVELDSITQYIADQNPVAAVRFQDCFKATVDLLIRFPEAGAIVPTRNVRLKGLRRISIRQMRNYVVYYFLRSGIEIVTVLHCARDRDAILEDEF